MRMGSQRRRRDHDHHLDLVDEEDDDEEIENLVEEESEEEEEEEEEAEDHLDHDGPEVVMLEDHQEGEDVEYFHSDSDHDHDDDEDGENGSHEGFQDTLDLSEAIVVPSASFESSSPLLVISAPSSEAMNMDLSPIAQRSFFTNSSNDNRNSNHNHSNGTNNHSQAEISTSFGSNTTSDSMMTADDDDNGEEREQEDRSSFFSASSSLEGEDRISFDEALDAEEHFSSDP